MKLKFIVRKEYMAIIMVALDKDTDAKFDDGVMYNSGFPRVVGVYKASLFDRLKLRLNSLLGNKHSNHRSDQSGTSMVVEAHPADITKIFGGHSGTSRIKVVPPKELLKLDNILL